MTNNGVNSSLVPARRTRFGDTTFTIIVMLALASIGSCQGLTIVAAPDSFYMAAPNSLISMYGTDLAGGTFLASDAFPGVLPTNLGGVSATVTDSTGHSFPISLIAVSQNQVNALLPSGLNAVGGYDGSFASVTLTTGSGVQVSGKFTLGQVSPALFTADETGGWLASAQVLITHADGTQVFMPSIASCPGPLVFNGKTFSPCVPIPINLGSSSDTAVLELFGTGIRGALGGQVQINDDNSLTVLYAGPQAAGAPGSFYGLDQVNIVLPHYLTGAGIISLTILALAGYNEDGVGEAATSNTVNVYIQ